MTRVSLEAMRAQPEALDQLGLGPGWLVIAVLPIVASVRTYRRDRQAAALGLAVTSVFLIFSMAPPHMYSRSWVVPLLIALSLLFTRKKEPAGTGNPLGDVRMFWVLPQVRPHKTLSWG